MNADALLAYYERFAEAPDAVARLRRFVLNLAVRGRLVPQAATDHPIAVARSGGEPESTGLPSSWRHVRLAELLREDTRNGYSRRPDDAADGMPILRISAGTVRWDGLVAEEEHKLISGIDEGTREEYGLCPGDLLSCRFNGNKAFVGRFTIFADYSGIKPIYPDKLIRVRVNPDAVLPEFLRVASEADSVRAEIEAYCTTTVGNWGISATNLKEVRFPIPPVAEQRRIVAKVDELMALCDRLEAARAEREAKRDRLTTASLARLSASDPETLQADAGFALDTLSAVTTRPDQVKLLRHTILSLAVRGKLAPQCPEEESAERLNARVQRERSYILADAQLRAKHPVKVASSNVGGMLPNGWTVEALGNLVDPSASVSYGVLVPGPDVEGGIPFVRAQDLALSGHPPRPQKTIAPEIEAPYARTRLRGGEILLCVVGSIGKLGVAPAFWAGANIARAVARVAPMKELSTDYMLLTLRSDLAQS